MGAGEFGQSASGGQEHGIGDAAGLADEHAQADAGEDKGIVALADDVLAPLEDLTGSKGEPVATRARPSECCRASEGVHSALLVGLLSGKMMGRSQWSAIARMAAGVKSPGWPVVPIRTVG